MTGENQEFALFISHQTLHSRRYLKDDTLFLQLEISPLYLSTSAHLNISWHNNYTAEFLQPNNALEGLEDTLRQADTTATSLDARD